MNCQDMDKTIPLFINDNLRGNDLRDFLLHVESCPICYEEMETEFLLKEALLRLEGGESFNLKKELQSKIRSMKMCLAIHGLCSLMRRVTYVVSLCMLVFAVYIVYVL